VAHDVDGWLASTIDDYWKFVSMLLAGGTGQGERILSPATVARTRRLISVIVGIGRGSSSGPAPMSPMGLGGGGGCCGGSCGCASR
jgi:CubicO group peptidase (beta-lactamase class C family)